MTESIQTPDIAPDFSADIPPEITTTSAETVAESPKTEPSAKSPKPKIDVQPVLQKLFELYPHLFGNTFLPLKLGTYQDLMAAHPDVFQKDSLKAALGFHARSTRYLQCVVAGNKRHDLQGNPVDDVLPEHIYVSLLQLFSRRQARSKVDLRSQFRAQLIDAFASSGLSRQEYQLRVQTNEAAATLLLEESLAEYDTKFAKQTALKRAFESSGKSAAEFADMYGLDARTVKSVLGSH